jgi:hypothetical protein
MFLGIKMIFPLSIPAEWMWERMASCLKPAGLAAMLYKEVNPEALETILSGSIRGRVLVRL